MNYKLIVLMMLVVGVLIAGCAQSGPPSGYATYSGGEQQQQYVGGGCGLASSVSGDASELSDVIVAPVA